MEDSSNKIQEPKNKTSDTGGYELSGKLMFCSVIVLFTAIIVIICFHSYSRWFFNRRLSRRRRRLVQQRLSSLITAVNTTSAPQIGLDPSIRKALPTFTYDSKTQDSSLECAVCLSEFEDDQEGRILPKCKHAFHVACIDRWFQSHANCPLCRAPVQPENAPESSGSSVQMGGGPPGLERELSRRREEEEEEEEEEVRCSVLSTPTCGPSHLECERKSVELVDIVAEMPPMDQRFRSLVEMGLGSAGRQEYSKSNVGRVLSLKRIWSI